VNAAAGRKCRAAAPPRHRRPRGPMRLRGRPGTSPYAIERRKSGSLLSAMEPLFPGCVKTPKVQSRTKKLLAGRANIRHSCTDCRPPLSLSAIPAQAGIQRKSSAVRAHCGDWRPAPALKGARSARIIHWIPACAGMAEGGALFAGCPQGFYTDCFAGMARWGRGNGGVGFIRWVPAEFLHSLFRTHHSPLEGESARRGRKPEVAPVGGASKAPPAPHRPGEPQGPHRLPLKGGVMGRMRRGQESTPHGGVRIFSPRLRNGLRAGTPLLTGLKKSHPSIASIARKIRRSCHD